MKDLKSLYSELCEEWDYDKNGALLPSQVSYGSKKKVWWLCKEGHSWCAAILNRKNGSGCPICYEVSRRKPRLAKTKKKLRFNDKSISYPQKILYFYIHKYFDDAQCNYRCKELNFKEIDVYIPSKNIGIEYDGERWHTDPVKDKVKDDLCHNGGISLYRIREPKCPCYISPSVHITLKDYRVTTLEIVILNLLKIFGVTDPIINVVKDNMDIINLTDHLVLSRSLQNEYPEISKEWDYEKNGKLLPCNVHSKSHKKVWWKCSTCGNEYLSNIEDRTKGHSCPKCKICKVGKFRSTPKNGESLMCLRPQLSEEWNQDLNGFLTPNDVKCGSKKKVWWTCSKCGNVWQATIDNRARGSGCPKCKAVNFGLRKSKPKQGGSLYDLYKEIIDQEWDYEKNIGISPKDISPHSRKIIAWRCKKCGYCWYSTVNDRTRNNKCHICKKGK